MKFDLWHINRLAYDNVYEGLSPLVSAVLRSRNVQAADLDYLRREIIHSPLLMTDMQKGAARIEAGIKSGEKIAVYGDYDVDGITSACVIELYLKNRGVEPIVYIPERLEEGYGLSKDSLDKLKELGVSLIITVDCGITAIEEALYASKMGMDLVITDHHESGSKIPEAVAVIDPKRKGDKYPHKNLAGVGVAFKLICAIEGEGSEDKLLDQYGDLIALGTVADMMPLVNENRYMVRRGLEILNLSPRPGVKALLDESGTNSVNAQSISFTLAPRINAAGRMGSASLAQELLSQEDAQRASFLASQLSNLNKLRQSTEAKMLRQAEKMIKESEYEGGPIVLYAENWHKGVVGIVAAKLMRLYLEPVVLISLEDGIGTGSCRSIDGFNIFSALSSCSDYLDNFGGHENAAGITISENNLDIFKETFVKYYIENNCSEESNTLSVDFSVNSPSFLSVESIKSLDVLEPFGTGNLPPTLCIENAELKKIIPLSGGKHVRLIVEKWNTDIDCIFFSVSPADLGLYEGDTVDIAFTPQINEFRGNITPQMLLADIRKANEDLSVTNMKTEYKIDYLNVTQCPERCDFTLLYKYLNSCKDKSIKGNRNDILRHLATNIGTGTSEKYNICIEVFSELGLLTKTENGNYLTISVTPNPKKVDLSASLILQKLKTNF